MWKELAPFYPPVFQNNLQERPRESHWASARPLAIHRVSCYKWPMHDDQPGVVPLRISLGFGAGAPRRRLAIGPRSMAKYVTGRVLWRVPGLFWMHLIHVSFHRGGLLSFGGYVSLFSARGGEETLDVYIGCLWCRSGLV